MSIAYSEASLCPDDGSAAILRLVKPSRFCFLCWTVDQSDRPIPEPFPYDATSALCGEHAAQLVARSDALKSEPMLTRNEYAAVLSLLRGHVDSRLIPVGYRFTPLTASAMADTQVLLHAGLAVLVEHNGYGIACFAMTARCSELSRRYALSQGVQ